MTQSSKLIQKGQPETGRIQHPVSEINYLDYDYHNTMDKPEKGWRKRMDFNQFHFYGITSPELYMGIAIINLRWVSSAFIYLYDHTSGDFEEVSLIAPLATGTDIGLTPDHNQSVFRWFGSHFSFSNEGHHHELAVQTTKGLQCRLRLTAPEDWQPMRLCCPAGYNGWVYTQKLTGMAVSGDVTCRGNSFRLEDFNCKASSDYTAGFMRRETVWKWASISGEDTQHRDLGLNLANGVNETGMSENTLWLDGIPRPLAPVQFSFDRFNDKAPWNVSAEDGSIDLTFKPLGVRKSNENFIILASNFRQYFGTYSGSIRLENGETITLEDQPGFAEDHYARW